MDTVESFQPVLAELAEPLAKQADTLLDLREAVLGRRAPGKCVTCYFKLLAIRSARGGSPRLTPLRRWIERHIEVVAQDDKARELERAPLAIGEGENLESFARRLMNQYFEDRGHLGGKVHLNFAYRRDLTAAGKGRRVS